MKKLIALILAAILVCGMFAGCESERPGGNVTPLPTSGSSVNTPEPTQETNTPADATGSSVVGKDVSMGAMEGGVYTNEYVGYGCKLDESWTFATAEQLQELPDNVNELLADSELGSAMDALPQFFDMQAENVTDLVSINVVYQKLDLATRAAYAMLSESQILDQALTQKDAMISSYASAGIIASSIEKVTVTFLGQERSALLTTATINDTPYFILQLFDYHLGQYSVITTLASYVENNTDSLLELFYPLD